MYFNMVLLLMCTYCQINLGWLLNGGEEEREEEASNEFFI